MITQFVVQLEYLVEDDWLPVVRYDHDPGAAPDVAHDVTVEGLHIDIYREGEKHATEYITGPLPAAEALDHAEDHLAKNLYRFIRRYQEWHGIKSR